MVVRETLIYLRSSDNVCNYTVKFTGRKNHTHTYARQILYQECAHLIYGTRESKIDNAGRNYS